MFYSKEIHRGIIEIVELESDSVFDDFKSVINSFVLQESSPVHENRHFKTSTLAAYHHG